MTRVRKLCSAVIRKQGLSSDIVNFGEELRVQHQSVWQRLDWKKVFPQVPFKVAVELKIQRDGTLDYAAGKRAETAAADPVLMPSRRANNDCRLNHTTPYER